MTASEIRAELEQLAANGKATSEDYTRLSQAWQAIKAQTRPSYHPVIEDRLRSLKHELNDFQTSYENIAAVCRKVFS